jgi:O-antigen ligase
MNSKVVVFVLWMVSIPAVLCALYFTCATENSKFLLPVAAVVSFLLVRNSPLLWMPFCLLSVFLDVRGEVGGVPIHFWEAIVAPVAVLSVLQPTGPIFPALWKPFVVLFLVAVVSAVLNSLFGVGLKSALRWLEYLMVYRSVAWVASSLTARGRWTNIGKQIAFPLICVSALAIVQSTVIKTDWEDIIQGPAGSVIFGPTEADSRSGRNNFELSGDTEGFRASAFYNSAVDLSAVAMISIAALFLQGRWGAFRLLTVAMGGCTLIVSMGRAALLYGSFAMLTSVLLFKRSVKNVLMLGMGCGFLAALLAVSPAAMQHLQTLGGAGAEEERTLIWATGMNVWRSSPIYGKGGGSTSAEFDENAAVHWLQGRQASTHSTYVGTLAELGVVGMLAWLYFLYVLSSGFWGAERRQSATALLCFCWVFFVVMGISSDTYTAGNPYFILLLSIFAWNGCGQPRVIEEEESDPTVLSEEPSLELQPLTRRGFAAGSGLRGADAIPNA